MSLKRAQCQIERLRFLHNKNNQWRFSSRFNMQKKKKSGVWFFRMGAQDRP